MSAFDIIRRSPRQHRSLQTPASAALRGIAFQESAVAGVAELSDGLKPLAGFLTRDVAVGGPVLGDHVYPGRLELPFTAGGQASFEQGEEIEIEGSDYIGDVTGATPLESDLSFTDGKVVVKAGSQLIFYRLKEIMTPETAGNVRIRIAQVNL